MLSDTSVTVQACLTIQGTDTVHSALFFRYGDDLRGLETQRCPADIKRHQAQQRSASAMKHVMTACIACMCMIDKQQHILNLPYQ